MSAHPFPEQRIATAPHLATPVTEAGQAVPGALRELRYGVVEVVVHSDRIVRITRSEKVRFDGR